MKFALSSKCPKTDTLFLLLSEGQKLSKELSTELGKATSELIDARIKAKDFEGKDGQMLALYPEKSPCKKLVLVGLGDGKDPLPNALEQLGGKLAGASKGTKQVAIHCTEDKLSELGYGFVLGSYEFTKYKKADKKAANLESVTFVTSATAQTKKTLASLQHFHPASILLRDLVNTPAGDLNTKHLEQAARDLAKKWKLKCTVLDEAKLKKLGCGAIVGVGKGAEVGPRMVILEYKYKTKSKVPSLAFIGKGLVFDTGGLNLKPTGYIETMKEDMAGAATVLATFHAIAQAKLPGHFIAVLCCAENAISDKAVHPGDVLTAFNKKTIEITNTDAEGRLVLADGLSYTEATYKPKMMVNIATLTGAVSVALGYNITGIMGNDAKLLGEIMDLSKSVHERMWVLPLEADFMKACKGEFTDLKNSTDGVRAGTIMGAAFLKHFVEKTPWAHFDIGGTAWAERPTSTTKYGATASALRTFIALAEKHQG